MAKYLVSIALYDATTDTTETNTVLQTDDAYHAKAMAAFLDESAHGNEQQIADIEHDIRESENYR